MRTPIATFFVLALSVVGWAQAPAPTSATAPSGSMPTRLSASDYTRTEDVVYGRKFGVALTMDVFQPTRASNGVGIISLVSGGWRSSHESINISNYAPFLERGYTVFAVVHGSQPKFIIEEIIPDIHRAVRFVRFNAARWKIDPEKLGITGSSAGGHLSLTLGTQGGPGAADSKDPVNRVSSAVQAVACFYPPTDFLNYGEVGSIAVAEKELANYRGAFGPDSLTVEGRQRLGELLSPARYITAQLPPTLIVHGDADKLVPLQQSEWFVEKAKAAGVADKVRLIVKAGGAHGWPNSNVERTFMADWFDLNLRGIPAGATR